MCNTMFCKRNSFTFMSALVLVVTLLSLCGCTMQVAETTWRPVEGRIMTRWAKDVRPGNVHREHPRPQMVRKHWLNLNGLWDYAICSKGENRPQQFDGKILVPFPVESSLSGVMRRVGEENRLWYRRTFQVPGKWQNKRVLLHFGAVDWETTIWVNGKELGTHRGGYNPFTLDITDVLKQTGLQELLVAVWDPTDAGGQPRGKQVRKPRGIWYTPTTGIWQTVWLEPVSAPYIKSLRIVPDIDAEQVRVIAVCSAAATGYTVHAEAKDGWFTKGKGKGLVRQKIIVPIRKPKLWSPDSPFLYDLKVTLKDSKGKKVDSVDSYFGMRKISLGKDKAGITRIFFNNKVLFQYGPLDQGFWPDGVYTAPTDEALRYDIEVLKRLGCNMMRKHVKIEPLRFYYWCDKLGMIVWQDMPNANNKSDAHKIQFEIELKRLVDTHFNHPSIVMWIAFNEGWGQYDAPRLAKFIKRLDPTRLVNNASGWTDRKVGDVHDVHKYPGPKAPKNEANRAAVLGEFGGLGRAVKGHLWQKEGSWGHHGTVKTEQEMTDSYLDLLNKLRPLIKGGLCAAVYTQTTDVEIEVNGFMTYNRAMVKMDAERITAANKGLYQMLP